MRIPLSWLNEFISLSSSQESSPQTTYSPDQLAKILTMGGLEVDHYETVGENLKEIVVARVLETSKHPNADKLTVASVTDGTNIYQIVCGASNCRPGIKTALARVGVTVGEGDQAFTIKKAKLRGVESEGMLCSEDELGLAKESDGIMELSDLFPEGSSLYDCVAETYFDISLTPNLSHCTSVMGVARELSALTGIPFHLPIIGFEEGNRSTESDSNQPIEVEVIDRNDCPRYACRVIENITVAPSPEWLRRRIEQCGLRSINNVVDVTNYVLLERGHPLHAFDLDKLEKKKIVIRKAKSGETIQTLDGKERALKEEMLVICDAVRPVAIAGVMGGANSEVSDQTTHIVLESAYFDPMSIRRTSKQLGLQTDASKRFERGTDPNQIVSVLDYAAFLIQQVAGGNVVNGRIDSAEKTFPETVVSCRLSRVNQIIGRTFSRGEVEEIFKRLNFHCTFDGQETFSIRVPTFRCDIKGEIDLIEEVVRLYGYDDIPRKGGTYQASTLPSVPIYLFEKEVRARLIGEGLQEFVTSDLIGPTLLKIVYGSSLQEEGMIKVLNPTSIEQSILRTSMLPGLLQVIRNNFDHQNRDLAGFEVGRIHFQEGSQYKEQSVMGIILTGQAESPHWDQKERSVDFFDLKGIIENVLSAFGISNYHCKNLGLETFHTGRQASIFVGSLEIGTIGEIHPAIQRRLDIPQRIIFGEFNLQDLMQIVRPLEKVTSLPIYPCSERDWTITVNNSLSFATIIEIIEKQGSSILEKVLLKDIYRSEKLGKDRQNMTFRFIYRDLSKTIEQEVVETEHRRLTTAVIESAKI